MESSSNFRSEFDSRIRIGSSTCFAFAEQQLNRISSLSRSVIY